MNFLKKYYSQLLFSFVGMLAGFFITRLPIRFDETISWIGLANFFLTIILAIYLEFVVRPSLNNNRNEKDFLIEQLKDMRSTVNDIQEHYIDVRTHNPLNPDDKSVMISKLRIVSNQIDLFKYSDERCSISRSTEMSTAIFKAYLIYKKSLTGYQFDKGSFFFDRLYWNKHENSFQHLAKLIMHTIIDINKA